MSHEKTVTVEIDGKFYNVKTVVNGKQLGARAATNAAIKNKSLGRGYLKKDTAVGTAVKRSKSFGKKRR